MQNIGSFVFCTGVIHCFQSIQTYMIDAYTKYAASVVSTLICTRGMTAFAFPLFGPYLFDTLGFGWGSSLLAFVALDLDIIGPTSRWICGPFLGGRSTFAAAE